MLRLVSWAVAGNDPLRFGVAPVPAANLALARAGIGFDDLDVIELNEAFAVQVLACLADWGLDAEDPRLNPRGSGISIGHPIGATGIRMLATLAHELPALDGDARARDDVHRRRPGARGGVRARVTARRRSGRVQHSVNFTGRRFRAGRRSGILWSMAVQTGALVFADDGMQALGFLVFMLVLLIVTVVVGVAAGRRR